MLADSHSALHHLPSSSTSAFALRVRVDDDNRILPGSDMVATSVDTEIAGNHRLKMSQDAVLNGRGMLDESVCFSVLVSYPSLEEVLDS